MQKPKVLETSTKSFQCCTPARRQGHKKAPILCPATNATTGLLATTLRQHARFAVLCMPHSQRKCSQTLRRAGLKPSSAPTIPAMRSPGQCAPLEYAEGILTLAGNCGLMCQQRNADHPSTQQLCQMRHIHEIAYPLPGGRDTHSCHPVCIRGAHG